MPFYAVKRGVSTGIFDNWKETATVVQDVPHALYKKFKTREEAQKWMESDDADGSPASPKSSAVQLKAEAAAPQPDILQLEHVLRVSKHGVNVYVSVVYGQKCEPVIKVVMEDTYRGLWEAIRYAKRLGWSRVTFQLPDLHAYNTMANQFERLAANNFLTIREGIPAKNSYWLRRIQTERIGIECSWQFISKRQVEKDFPGWAF